MEKKQNILILGANGFIGSTLCAHLLAKTQHEIYAVDLSTHKLAPCINHPRLHFYEKNLMIHHEDIEYLVSKCDVVLPLVAIATPNVYVTKPLSVFELDFEANLQVIRWCVKYHKRVIFPSTSEVYGMAPDASFDEHATCCVLGPIEKQRWIYSCCKQLMDRIIYAYGYEQGLSYTIFRPFNFIGAKLDNIHNDTGSRILTQFLHNALNHQPLKLVDGGTNRRCFTYIDDGIDCLVRIVNNENGCADNGIFNIGNPNENYSIAELAQIVKEGLVEFDPKLADSIQMENVTSEAYYGAGYQDVSRRIPSIKESQTKLGWQPKVSLREALHTILTYHFKGIDPDESLVKNAKR
ncbi:MAG: bifunctional UDP-4-keto-pentose/UDP-xylose synthase [Opitutales bacterium]|nr:bifunctional UDP-4-keto-pentose/UDP-xylose synthase [Opitutales bacterium]